MPGLPRPPKRAVFGPPFFFLRPRPVFVCSPAPRPLRLPALFLLRPRPVFVCSPAPRLSLFARAPSLSVRPRSALVCSSAPRLLRPPALFLLRPRPVLSVRRRPSSSFSSRPLRLPAIFLLRPRAPCLLRSRPVRSLQYSVLSAIPLSPPSRCAVSPFSPFLAPSPSPRHRRGRRFFCVAQGFSPKTAISPPRHRRDS